MLTDDNSQTTGGIRNKDGSRSCIVWRRHRCLLDGHMHDEGTTEVNVNLNMEVQQPFSGKKRSWWAWLKVHRAKVRSVGCDELPLGNTPMG